MNYDPLILDEQALAAQREALQAFWRRTRREERLRSRWFWRLAWLVLAILLLQTYLAWELIAVVALATPWTLLIAGTVAWRAARRL